MDGEQIVNKQTDTALIPGAQTDPAGLQSIINAAESSITGYGQKLILERSCEQSVKGTLQKAQLSNRPKNISNSVGLVKESLESLNNLEIKVMKMQAKLSAVDERFFTDNVKNKEVQTIMGTFTNNVRKPTDSQMDNEQVHNVVDKAPNDVEFVTERKSKHQQSDYSTKGLDNGMPEKYNQMTNESPLNKNQEHFTDSRMDTVANKPCPPGRQHFVSRKIGDSSVNEFRKNTEPCSVENRIRIFQCDPCEISTESKLAQEFVQSSAHKRQDEEEMTNQCMSLENRETADSASSCAMPAGCPDDSLRFINNPNLNDGSAHIKVHTRGKMESAKFLPDIQNPDSRFINYISPPLSPECSWQDKKLNNVTDLTPAPPGGVFKCQIRHDTFPEKYSLAEQRIIHADRVKTVYAGCKMKHLGSLKSPAERDPVHEGRNSHENNFGFTYQTASHTDENKLPCAECGSRDLGEPGLLHHMWRHGQSCEYSGEEKTFSTGHCLCPPPRRPGD